MKAEAAKETGKTPAEVFFQDGLLHIEAAKKTGRDPCHAIKPGDTEWAYWRDYLLKRLGKLPETMQMVERGELKTWTAPDQWPEWFDSSYVPPAVIPAVPRHRPEPSLDERARIAAGFDALIAKLAANLSMGKTKPKAPPRDDRPLVTSPELEEVIRRRMPAAMDAAE